MRNDIRHILLFFGIVCSLTMAAQGDIMSDVYDQARNDYEIGRFEESVSALRKNIHNFGPNLRQRAYRLLSLCYLAEDSIEQCEYYASLLIKENGNYTSVEDPVRFEEIVNRLKQQTNIVITTASSKEENIVEAPVPVSIITRQMIDALSYNKSLNAILAAYVPGFTEVSAATMENIAVHGVYTSGQEKILVMENGHRLNARSTNTGKMDYSISTEKIDHIEVLRGPASSLYGNVALTAVVNIITRKGSDVDGVKVKYGFGENRTNKVDVLYGNTLLGADILVWGSLYQTLGEKVFLPQNTGFSNSAHNRYVPIGRYDDRPSYDWGTNIRMKDFSVMLSRKHSKLMPQFTLYGETYDYDKYRSIDGQTPGFSLESTHAELNYNKFFGDVNLNISLNGDLYKLADYTVLSDSIIFTRYNTDGTSVKDAEGNPVRTIQKGLSQKTDWREYTVGMTAKADVPYRFGGMHGNLLFGLQLEMFSLYSTDYYLGENYDQIELVMPESLNAIDEGKERSTSFFMQDKHYLFRNFIVNAGIRYDRKHRKSGKIIRALSPRIAFIYTPMNAFNVKLSLSKSFVDAPYFYRQNKTNTYSGGVDLMPEYMNAIQLDFMGTFPLLHFSYDVNLFYNYLTDIINNTQKVGESTAAKYRNSGRLKICGAETELHYQNESLIARLVGSLQIPISAEDYYMTDGYIHSVPKFFVTLNGSKKIFSAGKHSLWASASGSYHAKTYHLISERNNLQSYPIYLDDRWLLDIGIRYHFSELLRASIDIENVFNKNYYIGGTTSFPYQHLGRVAMASISIHL